MKTNVVLLFSTDPLVEQTALQAVRKCGRSLRHIQLSRDAFAALAGDCSEIDVAVIDLDPGMHGQTLFNAAAERLPCIVLTSLEKNYVDPIARRHGAVACLEKPFGIEQLRETIESASAVHSGARPGA